jgi:flagellar biosynthesis protein FlhF
LQELRALLAEAQPDEVHLVLGCIAGSESLRTAARAFVSTGANSLILTKLDEAWQTGSFAEWLAACRLPLSYTTHGQNVPDDIHPASALKLAELILPGSPQ